MLSAMLTFCILISAILILLSLWIMILGTIFNPILLMKQRIYTTSLAACSRVMYFTSVIDIHTICYFLLFHKTITVLKKKQYLVINLQSLRSLAKLLLAYPISLYGRGDVDNVLSNFLPYIKSNYIVFFKYLKTLFVACKWLFIRSALYLLRSPIRNVMFNLIVYAKYMSLPMKY